LNTTKLIVRLYYSPNARGSNQQEVVLDTSGGADPADWIGAFLRHIGEVEFQVQVGGRGLSRSGAGILRSGFVRVLAIALP
jgi:hypothetical protein